MNSQPEEQALVLSDRKQKFQQLTSMETDDFAELKKTGIESASVRSPVSAKYTFD